MLSVTTGASELKAFAITGSVGIGYGHIAKSSPNISMQEKA